MSVSQALGSALADVPLRACDGAAVELAKAYAAEIDDGEDLRKTGPLLLAVLESLGMTPKGRAAVVGKGAPDGERPRSPLDELRERRAARAN